jgi:hypothetical protein
VEAMKKPWENDSCEHVQSYYTVYPVSVAAALWCSIPPSDVQEHLNLSTQVFTGVYRHPYIPCLEPRCRAIHGAIENGVLPVSRENGKSLDGSKEHVKPDRRHVSRQDLKEWIAREFPADKPAFLFDEIERKTHTAINVDAYRTLQADHDALKARIDKAEEWAKTIKAERNALLGERDSLRATVEKMNVPGERAETTYLNIIGAMLDLMLTKSPGGKPHSVFDNQTSIIDALLAHYDQKPGISSRTLDDKFAAAKRSLKAT